ncbi:hypothetical protein P280DRAFT_472579 [Massarina eburnea CBS 473.64]|uniref:Zn(2)-C6 fungal-type domain-containing protein n=1 Tax=Massarina eburnea CBS 473.64 TaxID=1395130 RepID=A0A6A6RPA0_9PLEO|nr:hypothetical protein P280DRAFT_472579 [Massarina eburnea CBS 473.64]
MVDLQTEKLHAACDECRTRKLKCSGIYPTCNRCEREGIRCVYSPRKPMGRPRKRRRDNSSEQAEQLEQAARLSKTPVTDSFELPEFNDLAVLTAFDELSGFNFRMNDGFSGPMSPPSYPVTTMNNGFENEVAHDMNFSPDAIDPSIDPSLWNAQPSDSSLSNVQVEHESITAPQQPSTDTCSCFSLMFLAVSELQSITSFAFPAIVPHLRSAASTANTIIHCEKCPLQAFSAIQNIQSLTSLLSSLAERYHKVLSEIEAEAARAEVAGEKKPFRVGDNSQENSHLHTGTLDCPMGFNVELEPRDWKRMCKTALKTEVLGGGGFQMPLAKLLDEFEKRQRRWHADKSMNSEERTRIFGAHDTCKGRGEMAMCLRMVHSVRKMIGTMKWED